MSSHAAAPVSGAVYVERRRARILEALGRPAHRVASGAEPLAADRIENFRRQAEDLYDNELAWEELTDEEAVPGGHLTEMVFSGFLALIEGLLVEKVPADALAPARPHPDAVEEILTMLGDKYLDLTAYVESGADSQQMVYARVMTGRLIDLALYRLYGLTSAEIDRLEAGA
jgi:hypothetical protein